MRGRWGKTVPEELGSETCEATSAAEPITRPAMIPGNGREASGKTVGVGSDMMGSEGVAGKAIGYCIGSDDGATGT